MDPQLRPRIVTLGDLVVDVVASAAGPLAHGSDRAGRIEFRQGGSAANVARWVARVGGRAVFIGAIGRDAWGRQLHDDLVAAGVEVHAVTRPGAPTARIVALISPDGERTFVTDRGAADRLRSTDLRRAWFEGVAALHLPAYALFVEQLATTATRAVRLARSRGAIVSVDLASRRPILEFGPARLRASLAAMAPDVLFATGPEADALLEGAPEPELLAIAPLVVVKAGADGCRIWSGASPSGDPSSVRSQRLDVATRPIAATDTTGAGDAFAAGFLVTWLSAGGAAPTPASLKRAARAGHRAASRLLRSTTRPGVL